MMQDTFDMDSYIRQRILEIDDLDERRFAKEILLDGLGSVYELTNKRYLDLERRIERETEVSGDKYGVYMSVIRKQDYDPINETLFPVCMESSEEQQRENKNEQERNLIFFTGNHEKHMEFERTKELYAYDKKGQKHRVGVRKALCYQKAVSDLYDVFVYNKIRWTTVNTGYLDRFYEIFPLEETEDECDEWEVDYGNMEEFVHTDLIPIWNIEKFTFQCLKFMVPSIDDKYYEHELDLRNYDKNSGYMLGINEDVLEIRYEEDKIIMTSGRESFKDWIAYRFAENPDFSSYGYEKEVLKNCRNKSFSESFIAKHGKMFESKTEIYREFESFGLSAYLELTECRVIEKLPSQFFEADMNLFIKNEMFPMDTRNILELQFLRKAENVILCEDMIRFAVSQIQLSLNEYKCIGVLTSESEC